MAKELGFRSSCDLIAGTTLIFGLLYLCVGGGAAAFKNTCCKKDDKDYERLH